MKNKYIGLILLLILLVSCSKREVRETKLLGVLVEQYEVTTTSDGSFVKDGFYKTWYENGQININAEYENNKRNGNYKVWYKSGQLQQDLNYSNDSLDGKQIKYHKNGNILWEGQANNGSFEGLVTEYYENGQKKSEKIFKDDKIDGPFKYWNSDGSISIDGNYVNGLAEGERKDYFDSGKTVLITVFKADKNITLQGGKWLSDDDYILEFFDDNTYSYEHFSDKSNRGKGTYSIDGDNFLFDTHKMKINTICKESFSAEEKTSNLWAMNRHSNSAHLKMKKM